MLKIRHLNELNNAHFTRYDLADHCHAVLLHQLYSTNLANSLSFSRASIGVKRLMSRFLSLSLMASERGSPAYS
jgi:hypothetical protein